MTSPGPGVELEEGQHECARKVDVAEKELHDPRVSKGRKDVMSFYRAPVTIKPLRLEADGEGVGLPRKVAARLLLRRLLMPMRTCAPVIKVGSAAILLLAGRAF